MSVIRFCDRRPSASALLILLMVSAASLGAADLSPLAVAMDRNGDRQVTKEELSPSAGRTLLAALDANGDGALDTDELLTIGRGGAGLGRRSRSGPANWDYAETSEDGIRIFKNIEYATGPEYAGGRGKLDVYVPEGEGPFAVIVFFHGGGLTNGDKDSLAGLGPHFARLGFLTVTPNYRLSPDFYYPAYVEDGARAFKWSWEHADDYGGDRESLVVSGGSAGGHVAALLSVDERFLAAQGLSLANIKVSLPITAMMDATGAGRERVLATWAGDLELAERASPIRYVGPQLPPMLITVADGDTEDRRNQNQQMFEAMKSAGHRAVEFAWLVDRTHNSILPNMLEEGDPTVELLLAFMSKHGVRGRE